MAGKKVLAAAGIQVPDGDLARTVTKRHRCQRILLSGGG